MNNALGIHLLSIPLQRIQFKFFGNLFFFNILTTLKVVQQIQFGSHEIIRSGHINHAFSATIVTKPIPFPDMGELQERKMDYKEKKNT
jgi:hypothetical protein